MKQLNLSNKETVEVQDDYHEYLDQFIWHRAADGTVFTTITRPNGRVERLTLEFVIDRDLRPLTIQETADQLREQFGEWLSSAQAVVVRQIVVGMFEAYIETLANTLKSSLNLTRREAILITTTATALALESLEAAVDDGEFDKELHEQDYTQEQIEAMHRKTLHS